ncbi:hypothetical protein [Methylocystis sp. ATCC 49242]|uniref:hypothetical protein n=1 Tax=Methylocystis sp. ATCC 49242 TaxID=622637 RepID=UPI00130D8158|nr:hypothetical protein [Methylocystis sp. ATCC 49242]
MRTFGDHLDKRDEKGIFLDPCEQCAVFVVFSQQDDRTVAISESSNNFAVCAGHVLDYATQKEADSAPSGERSGRFERCFCGHHATPSNARLATAAAIVGVRRKRRARKATRIS